jgi:prevent-host-death family protein
MQATMHEAKTSLSKLVARALATEDVILTSRKARTPTVRLVPVAQPENAPLSEAARLLHDPHEVLQRMKFTPLVLQLEHAKSGSSFVASHKDPSDRMLTACWPHRQFWKASRL